MPHPQSAVQAGIAVAHDAIGSLGAQPVLLLLVIINVVFITAAAFFLWKLEETRSALMLSTLDIVKTCVTGIKSTSL
jgi:hypothetical protein